ncbi:MAG: NAD-dependent epimerase/dehydratase family protein [Nitriliruptorales bacterium]
MGSAVAITGVGGLTGRELLGRLLADPSVDRIVGLDIAPPADLVPGPKLELRAHDVRAPDLAAAFEGCDAVYHLAFVMDERPDAALMRSVNIDGTRNVAEAAAKAGVSKLVYPSSYVAYGAHPDNDVPLHEDSPLRANPDFAYGEQKREVEHWLREWAEGHPELATIVFRPAIVAGPQADNWFVRMVFETPRAVLVKGYHPPLQLTHLDDLVDALVHALHHDLRGPYNVASEGWLRTEEVLDHTGLSIVEVPEGMVFDLADRLWRIGVAQGPPGVVHYFMHPVVMSVDRLRATGWEPRHTNREALQLLHDAHAPYVALKHGRRVRRRSLKVGAGLTGVALAALAIRAIRSERDR